MSGKKNKPAGYWTEENITKKILELIKELGRFPVTNDIRPQNITREMSKFGGMNYFRKKLGYEEKKDWSFINEEFLKKEYVGTGLTDTMLGEKLGCSGLVIKYYRKLFGIPQHRILQGTDITGKKFGKLLVIREDHRYKKRIYWLCKCDCGNKHVVTGHALKNGSSKSCGCAHYSIGEDHHNWKGHEEITGTIWKNIKQGARYRNIEWDLSIEDAYNLIIKQDFKCVLTDIPLVIGKNASIDRIESLGKYELSNIQWLDKDINVIKWDYSTERFIELCNCVINNSAEVLPIQIYDHKRRVYKNCGNICGDYWCRIVNNAKIRDKIFNITPEFAWDLYLKQNGKCAISGLPIIFPPPGKINRYAFTASLDRKDSKLDYEESNVWWVHKDINNIKWKLDLDYFYNLCLRVTQKASRILLGVN